MPQSRPLAHSSFRLSVETQGRPGRPPACRVRACPPCPLLTTGCACCLCVCRASAALLTSDCPPYHRHRLRERVDIASNLDARALSRRPRERAHWCDGHFRCAVQLSPPPRASACAAPAPCASAAHLAPSRLRRTVGPYSSSTTTAVRPPRRRTSRGHLPDRRDRRDRRDRVGRERASGLEPG
jgi:hypothetical protein